MIAAILWPAGTRAAIEDAAAISDSSSFRMGIGAFIFAAGVSLMASDQKRAALIRAAGSGTGGYPRSVSE